MKVDRIHRYIVVDPSDFSLSDTGFTLSRWQSNEGEIIKYDEINSLNYTESIKLAIKYLKEENYNYKDYFIELKLLINGST